jgi:hypothetical protein
MPYSFFHKKISANFQKIEPRQIEALKRNNNAWLKSQNIKAFYNIVQVGSNINSG